jgi:hypothetical protein
MRAEDCSSLSASPAPQRKGDQLPVYDGRASEPFRKELWLLHGIYADAPNAPLLVAAAALSPSEYWPINSQKTAFVAFKAQGCR